MVVEMQAGFVVVSGVNTNPIENLMQEQGEGKKRAIKRMKGNDDTVHFSKGSCLSLRRFSGCHSHVPPHAIKVTVIYQN